MAEIVVLPAAFDLAGAGRLIASIDQAVAAGTDLGPRGDHIRMLGGALGNVLSNLRREIDEIKRICKSEAFDIKSETKILENYLLIVEQLCITARDYSDKDAAA